MVFEKPNKYSIEDALFETCFNHLGRLDEAYKDGRASVIQTELFLYNKDIIEILEEAEKYLECEEIEAIMHKCRNIFSTYILEIFS